MSALPPKADILRSVMKRDRCVVAFAAVPPTHTAERHGDRWGRRTARQVVIKEHHYWARYSVLQITSM